MELGIAELPPTLLSGHAVIIHAFCHGNQLNKALKNVNIEITWKFYLSTESNFPFEEWQMPPQIMVVFLKEWGL